jgi:riboflavin synthase alpha subunit
LIAIFSLAMIAMPPEEKVQFVISKGNVTGFDNASLTIGNETSKTIPLMLIGSTDRTYLVLNDKGRKLELNKDLVEYIIYL